MMLTSIKRQVYLLVKAVMTVVAVAAAQTLNNLTVIAQNVRRGKKRKGIYYFSTCTWIALKGGRYPLVPHCVIGFFNVCSIIVCVSLAIGR